jgi:hypothetical protein
MEKRRILFVLCFGWNIINAQNSNAIFDTVIIAKSSINDLPAINILNNDGSKTILSRVNNNFNITNNNQRAGGDKGSAIFLNGNSMLTMSDAGIPVNGNPLTVSFWFKSNNTNDVGQHLMMLGNCWNPIPLQDWMIGYANGQLRVTMNGLNSNFPVVSYPSPGVWHHLVISYIPSSTFVMVDGSIIYSTSGISTITLNGLLYLGYYPRYTNYCNNTYLDQFVIYNTNLSALQAQQIYNNGVGTYNLPLNSNIIRRFNFDEGSGAVANDISGNNISGYITNANWGVGITPTSAVGTINLITGMSLTDGLTNNENGIQTFGDYDGRFRPQFKWMQFSQNGYYPFTSNNSGQFLFNSTNNSNAVPIIKSTVDIAGNLSLGTYASTNTAPTNGLIVSGRVGIGTANPNYNLDVYGRSNFSDTISGSHLKLIALGTANSTDSIVTVDSNGNLNKKDLGQLVTSSSLNGTVGYLSRFTSNNTLGNSSLYDNGIGVGVGTTNPGTYKLAVEGTIGARKVKVTQASWADYVFNDGYWLRPLTEVESFIKENKHLPEVPSAKEVEKNGVDVGDNQALLLKKIEELTLYMIQMNRDTEMLKKENNIMKNELRKLKIAK